jgi:hypothetical protein
MYTKTTNQNELTKWVFNTFKEKAKFDIKKTYRIQTDTMIIGYIEDCSYAMTVIPRSSSVMNVRHAQSTLQSSFNDYSYGVLGSQCMDLQKLTSRNRKFFPLVFLAFDIEGTRHNAFDVMTSNPHGHGVIMFDTQTVFNFRRANAQFRCEDGSYEIVNPTREIALIKLTPFCSIGGMKKFIHYSLKYAAKLKDNQINFRPFDFYPPASVNYPFWQYLSGTAQHSYALQSGGGDEQDALEWLWNVDDADRCFSRDIGYGRGETADWYPTI